MLEYDRIDVSRGVKRIFCHYWYFLEINFRFQTKVCDGCYDLMQNATSFNDAAIVSVKGNDYRILFFGIL